MEPEFFIPLEYAKVIEKGLKLKVQRLTESINTKRIGVEAGKHVAKILQRL